jgi:hypothetical protein
MAFIAMMLFAGIYTAQAQVTYTVGVNLTGLSAGSVILKNGSDTLNLSTNGSFTFSSSLASGAPYAVSVLIQPVGQACSVTGGDNGNGSGSISNSNVTVGVNCVSTYTVGGSISGLTATGLVLRLNATSLIVANGATTFKFASALTNGATYTVSVGIQPVGLTCSVNSGSGVISGANITNVAVNCGSTYSVGGSISGLTASGLILKLNGGANKIIPTNATGYVFSTGLTSGTAYSVSIQAQPTGYNCVFLNPNNGTIGNANVTNVNISCSNTPFTVGGTLTGLTTGQQVTLLNNGIDSRTLSANAIFTFPTPVISGGTYSVSIGTQPSTGICFVFNPSGGTVNGANVTNVLVSCTTGTLTVGGTVAGLGAGSSVTLLNNGGVSNGGSAITVSANGGFNFPQGLGALATYEVTVGTQPTGQTCSLFHASGTMVAATNVNNVEVTCVNGSTLNATIVLGAPTTNSIVMKLFSADQRGTVSVSYGTSPGSYSNITSPIALIPGGISTVFNIGNLTPDAQYYYRVNFTPSTGQFNGQTTQTPEYKFHTARPPGSTFVFTVQADSHLDESTDIYLYRQTLKNMVSDSPDFMVDLGDTFFLEKHNQALDTTATSPPATTEAQVISRYRVDLPYFGLATHSVPLFLANGNHEGEWGSRGSADLATWSVRARTNYYANPDPSSQPFYSGYTTTSGEPNVRSPSASWYSWKWGDALFVVLDPYWNSTGASGWGVTLGITQYNWLKDTLAQATASGTKYKFIFMHNLAGGGTSMRGGIEVAKLFEWGGYNATLTPGTTTNAFTLGSYDFATRRAGWSKPIHDLLVENKVTAVFHGHDHVYVRQKLDGIVYQEMAQPSARSTTNGNTLAGEGGYVGTVASSSGHLRVTVSPTGVKSEYIKSWVLAGNPDPQYPNNIENGSTRVNGTAADTWTCTYNVSGLCGLSF